MFIECYGNNAFGGRTSDVFYIENAETLDELQEYRVNNMPIKCLEPTAYGHGGIVVFTEELKERIVYLNNYMKIRKRHYIMMNRAERQQLEDTVCKKCSCNDGSLAGSLRCYYDKTADGKCNNYDEPLYASFLGWLKKKLGNET